jgi:hypothetical protein
MAKIAVTQNSAVKGRSVRRKSPRIPPRKRHSSRSATTTAGQRERRQLAPGGQIAFPTIKTERHVKQRHQRHEPGSDDKTSAEMRTPTLIWFKAKITPAAKAQRPDRGPEQNERGHQHGTIEVALKGNIPKKPKRSTVRQGITRPIKQRRKQRTEQHNRHEISDDLGEFSQAPPLLRRKTNRVEATFLQPI